MRQNFIKISKVANDLGITKQTLWRWKWNGDINFHKIGSLNYIDSNTYNNLLGKKEKKIERVVIYCRVSSSVNKTNLETQCKRVKQYCIINGYSIHKIIKEYGSGLNDDRKQLIKLLKEQDFTKLVIEHKDRLSRSGFNYIKTLLEFNNIEIEVINNSTDDEENIIQDFISIITSYCARIYGKRRSKRKTEQIIHELKSN